MPLNSESPPERDLKSALQRANADLFLDSAAYGIVVLHVDGTVLRVNPAFCEIFRYSKDELQGHYLDDLIVPAEKVAESREFRKAVLRGPHASISTRRRRSDGAMIDVAISGAPIDTGQGPIGTIFFYRDITDQRTLDQQMIEAQKMEAIGRLVGNVSHDFNNLLTAIMVYCGLLTESLGPHDAARQHAEEIYSAAEEGSELVRQLLSISRQRPLEPKLTSLSEIVQDLEEMLRRLLGENIELQIQAGPNSGQSEVDRSQIQQAILNLVLNARDAMPSGGRLAIGTAPIDVSPQDSPKHQVQAGQYVLLSVADTGIGIDEATRSRIFEPFFSTKPQGKGTGLGLASVHAIVTQAGGHIRVTSDPGRGSRFDLYLPRIASVTTKATTTNAADSAAGVAGRETVLLVEDQDRVRSGIAKALQSGGYKVISARHAEEALELNQKHEDDIHLLLTDMVMPGLGGDQLAEKILQLRPDIRVLFMSGYNLRPTATLLQRVKAVFAEKPIKPAVLLRTVRELLDRAA